MNVLRRLGPIVAALVVGVSLAGAAAAAPLPEGRVDLRLDTEEAEAVLAIAGRANTGEAVPDSAWQRLFSSRPYVRLKQREAEMRRPFTDDEFRAFVLSPALAQRADSLRRTLEDWRRTDLAASARRVLGYLPDSARIRAGVYPVIKPKTNSFVFQLATDAAIFLYLDPTESAAKFENTVAHEMHHIGFASVSGADTTRLAQLPPRVRTAVEWMGAFGEGFAMLAAAGGPDVHPHASSPPADRARWDRDMTHFDRDLGALDRFFRDVIDGRLRTDKAVQNRAFSFFGVQGPWYTVGYRMAVVVERRYGRAVLIQCMEDPRQLLVRYNDATVEANAGSTGGRRRAMWSAPLLRAIAASPPAP